MLKEVQSILGEYLTPRLRAYRDHEHAARVEEKASAAWLVSVGAERGWISDLSSR